MIVSASRRTDIPALYADWLAWRLREGYAEVANPYNAAQVRRVSLAVNDVDAIVYWSKNPAPLLDHPREFDAYPWMLHFTINDYPPALEGGIPPLEDRLRCFRAFSRRGGKERMSWRYDPILFAHGIDEAYHVSTFGRIATALEGFAERCTISFIDEYTGMKTRLSPVDLRDVSEEAARSLAVRLSEVAREHGMRVEACAEPYDLTEAGVERARCVDARRLRLITGKPVPDRRDKNQRPHCGCSESVDIGRYGTCTNGCAYCYAVKGKFARRAAAEGARL